MCDSDAAMVIDGVNYKDLDSGFEIMKEEAKLKKEIRIIQKYNKFYEGRIAQENRHLEASKIKRKAEKERQQVKIGADEKAMKVLHELNLKMITESLTRRYHPTRDDDGAYFENLREYVDTYSQRLGDLEDLQQRFEVYKENSVEQNKIFAEAGKYRRNKEELQKTLDSMRNEKKCLKNFYNNKREEFKNELAAKHEKFQELKKERGRTEANVARLQNIIMVKKKIIAEKTKLAIKKKKISSEFKNPNALQELLETFHKRSHANKSTVKKFPLPKSTKQRSEKSESRSKSKKFQEKVTNEKNSSQNLQNLEHAIDDEKSPAKRSKFQSQPNDFLKPKNVSAEKFKMPLKKNESPMLFTDTQQLMEESKVSSTGKISGLDESQAAEEFSEISDQQKISKSNEVNMPESIQISTQPSVSQTLEKDSEIQFEGKKDVFKNAFNTAIPSTPLLGSVNIERGRKRKSEQETSTIKKSKSTGIKTKPIEIIAQNLEKPLNDEELKQSQLIDSEISGAVVQKNKRNGSVEKLNKTGDSDSTESETTELNLNMTENSGFVDDMFADDGNSGRSDNMAFLSKKDETTFTSGNKREKMLVFNVNSENLFGSNNN